LRLRVERRGARSVLTGKRARGPLVVQKALYPEGDGVCHLCLIHPPGGVVGGDKLRLETTVETGAAALITTPGAAKFYRAGDGGHCHSDGERGDGEHSHSDSDDAPATARVTNRLRIGTGAALEFLPQEAIAFAGCRVAVDTVVSVAARARFIGWDMLCLGRPASADWYTAGRFDSRLRIVRDGRPLLIERNRYHAGDDALRAAWGLGGDTVTGALYALPAGDDALTVLREKLRMPAMGKLAGAVAGDGDHGETRFAATVIGEVLVLRVTAVDAEACRARLIDAWKILRPLVLNRPPATPRIWNT